VEFQKFLHNIKKANASAAYSGGFGNLALIIFTPFLLLWSIYCPENKFLIKKKEILEPYVILIFLLISPTRLCSVRYALNNSL